jgi:hypothetical protein
LWVVVFEKKFLAAVMRVYGSCLLVAYCACGAHSEDAAAAARAARLEAIKAGATGGKVSPQLLATEDHYVQPEPVNVTDCLDTILTLPLRTFFFKYDSVLGRRQIGVIGPELKKLMPESVTVLPTHPFPNPSRTGPKMINVRNYHSVDHNMLFMHNLGATQALVQAFRALGGRVDEQDLVQLSHNGSLTDLDGRAVTLEAGFAHAEERYAEESEHRDHTCRAWAERLALYSADGNMTSRSVSATSVHLNTVT